MILRSFRLKSDLITSLFYTQLTITILNFTLSLDLSEWGISETVILSYLWSITEVSPIQLPESYLPNYQIFQSDLLDVLCEKDLKFLLINDKEGFSMFLKLLTDRVLNDSWKFRLKPTKLKEITPSTVQTPLSFSGKSTPVS